MAFALEIPSEANITIIAITTKSSISVNACDHLAEYDRPEALTADGTQPGRALSFLMKLLNRFWNRLRLVDETRGGGGGTRGGYSLIKCHLASVSICCERIV